MSAWLFVGMLVLSAWLSSNGSIPWLDLSKHESEQFELSVYVPLNIQDLCPGHDEAPIFRDLDPPRTR